MRVAVVFIAACWAASASVAGAQPELLDRAVAIVGGQVVTQADVRTALTLGLVDTAGDADPVEAAGQRLIDRVLMLREVERYTPPEPAPAAIDARLAETRARVASPQAFAAALAAGGMSEARLREWVRDDLRIAGYLEQRFAAAGAAAEPEVAAYYNSRREDFERRGLTFEQAGTEIRALLASERRRELITDWISDLRRRTEILYIKP